MAVAEVRVRRMLAVCAAGRILNPKSARSQVIGASGVTQAEVSETITQPMGRVSFATGRFPP